LKGTGKNGCPTKRVLGRENRSWQDTEMQSAACAAGKGRSCF
jgi:hypothetical protein